MPDDTRMTFSEAMHKARDARKNDKRVDSMFQALKKWKKQRKEHGKTLRQCNDHMRPLEKAFDDKMLEYEKKEQAKYDEKHKKMLTTRDDTINARCKASQQIRASEYRIAKKFGFVRRTYRSQRRRHQQWEDDAVI